MPSCCLCLGAIPQTLTATVSPDHWLTNYSAPTETTTFVAILSERREACHAHRLQNPPPPPPTIPENIQTCPVPPQTWAPGEMRNNLCSYRQETQPRRVFHRHHTSKEIRRILGCKNDSDGFFCPTCRFCTGSPLTPGKFHDMTEEKRLRIVLSSSTLQGATIQDLLLMWRADYWNEKKPMDLLIIG